MPLPLQACCRVLGCSTNATDLLALLGLVIRPAGVSPARLTRKSNAEMAPHRTRLTGVVSQYREARWQARPAGGGQQQRAGQAVCDGEVGDDGERLRGGGRGDVR